MSTDSILSKYKNIITNTPPAQLPTKGIYLPNMTFLALDDKDDQQCAYI